MTVVKVVGLCIFWTILLHDMKDLKTVPTIFIMLQTASVVAQLTVVGG
jgi:hypothetical protein